MAACDRRDATRDLTQLRSILAAAGAAMSKQGMKGFRAFEKALLSVAERPTNPPTGSKKASMLAKLAVAAGAQKGRLN